MGFPLVPLVKNSLAMLEMSRRMRAHLLLWKSQKYNSLLNNHWQENVGSHREKIPYAQGQRIRPSKMVQFSSVHSLSHAQLFATPWITACQAYLSISNSQSLLKLMPIESVMPSSHLILCHPFSSCPQSLPASGFFPMSQLFAWGGHSIGVLASVLPMNTQDWSPSGWTGWISLQSKELSRVFSNTTVQKHQFWGTQLSSQ